MSYVTKKIRGEGNKDYKYVCVYVYIKERILMTIIVLVFITGLMIVASIHNYLLKYPF